MFMWLFLLRRVFLMKFIMCCSIVLLAEHWMQSLTLRTTLWWQRRSKLSPLDLVQRYGQWYIGMTRQKGLCSGLFCVRSNEKLFVFVSKKSQKMFRQLECGTYSISTYTDLCSANAIDSPLCLYWLVTVLTVRIDNLLGLFDWSFQ